MANCCEYKNSKNRTRNVLQCFCECDKVDESFDKMFNGENIPESEWDMMLNDMADRVRIPWPGGAKKVSIYLFLVPIIYNLIFFIATFSFNFTVICIFSLIIYIIRTSIINMNNVKHSRSKFLLCWTYWSIYYAMKEYYYVLRFKILVGKGMENNDDSMQDNINFSFGTIICDLLCILLIIVSIFLQITDPGKVEGVNPPRGTDARSLRNYYLVHKDYRLKYCRITNMPIKRYDHFCIWISKPIGFGNHRWFLLFLILMSIGTFLFSYFLMDLIGNNQNHKIRNYDYYNFSRLYHENRSTYEFAIFLYVFICFFGIIGLLSKQIYLISKNVTTYESIHFKTLFSDDIDLSWDQQVDYLKVLAQSAASRSPRRSVRTRIGEFHLVRNWLKFLKLV